MYKILSIVFFCLTAACNNNHTINIDEILDNSVSTYSIAKLMNKPPFYFIDTFKVKDLNASIFFIRINCHDCERLFLIQDFDLAETFLIRRIDYAYRHKTNRDLHDLNVYINKKEIKKKILVDLLLLMEGSLFNLDLSINELLERKKIFDFILNPNESDLDSLVAKYSELEIFALKINEVINSKETTLLYHYMPFYVYNRYVLWTNNNSQYIERIIVRPDDYK
jgi:hypothetical protein